MPDESIKKMNFTIYKFINNNDINNNSENKNLKFNEDTFLVKNVYEDGHCFYRCISHYLTGKETYHLFFRTIVYEFANENINEIIVNIPYIEYNCNVVNTDEYIPKIKISGIFRRFRMLYYKSILKF